MSLLIVFFSCAIGINAYFYIAEKYQIFDIPNERSSHSGAPIRGAGIIFPILLLGAGIVQSQYLLIAVGCFGLGVLSFLDDIKSLSSGLRFTLQVIFTFIAFSYFYNQLNLIWIAVSLFLTLAFLNAYNFMDGINGITAIYSLVLASTFFYINSVVQIFSQEIITWLIVSVLVFAFYNVRTKAVAFLGDVGSIPLGLFFSVLLISAIVQTDISFLLLVAVYGIDSGLTIFFRLLRKENIFKAHRGHLYQRFTNEIGMSHLFVSTFYGVIQLSINICVIINWHIGLINPILLLAICLATLSGCYLFLGRTWLFSVRN